MQSDRFPNLAPIPLLLRVVFATALTGTAAHAAEQDTASMQEASLPTVTISGRAENDSYTVKRTTSATKTDTVIRDIPQSITVINQALIKDQSMQSMADVARYVPGIGMANGEGNRDSPIFRGSTSASGDFYIDGVRDDVEYYRDLYNVERVEALTGPSAMIFGRGGSGGVINRVIKQANWSTAREIDLTLGNYRNRRAVIDIGQPINDNVAVRITGLAEDSGGYQRNAKIERSGINPTVAVRFSKDTTAIFGYEHFEDKRAADRGVPSLRGLPLDVPFTAFFDDGLE